MCRCRARQKRCRSGGRRRIQKFTETMQVWGKKKKVHGDGAGLGEGGSGCSNVGARCTEMQGREVNVTREFFYT